MKKNDHYHHIYDLCKDHMHAYVLVEMKDGTKMDGIVTGLDEENVYFAVPMSEGEMSGSPNSQIGRERQFGGGYGYGYGGYPPYGYHGYYPPRRFRRLVLPLAALAALSVLPWY